MNHRTPQKGSFKPKRHHGFLVVIIILGFILPPLAVAARFGIGIDFFINTILCICGYFPCHIHNFYIQNIRNNSNRARTPKWALKAGLVDNSDNLRRQRKSQWAKRYDERNIQSTHVGQPLEEGEEGENYIPIDPDAPQIHRSEGLWQNDDEEYYNPDEAPNQRHWAYPANFNGTVGDGRSKRRNQPASGDRWERTLDSQRAARSDTISSSSSSGYPPAAAAATDNNVPEWGRDYGSKRRSSKNKKKNTTAYNSSNNYNNFNGGLNGRANGGGSGGYGREFDDDWNESGSGAAGPRSNATVTGGQQSKRSDGDIFSHEF